jgi:hypothetical protein
MCYICRQQQESITHMFTECQYVTQLRTYVTDALPLSRQQCTQFKYSVRPLELITGEHLMFWREVEATTLFVLWRERCRRIFAEETKTIPNLTREIIGELKLWYYP